MACTARVGIRAAPGRRQRRKRIRRPCARQPRAQHPAGEAGAVEGRVLGARAERLGVEHPGHVGIDHDQVGRRAGGEAPDLEPEDFGRPAWRARGRGRAGRRRRNGTRRSAAGSIVSRPTAPSAASAKGWRLVSTSCGSWLETITSIDAVGDALDHRPPVVLGAQRRRQLEEGAVGADVVFVERQMVDRDAAGDGKAAGLGPADDVERLGAGDLRGVVAAAGQRDQADVALER